MEAISPWIIAVNIIFGSLYLIQLVRFGQLDQKGNPIAKRWMSIWIVIAALPVLFVILTNSVPTYLYFLLIGIIALAEALIWYCKSYHTKQIEAMIAGARDPAVLYAAARDLANNKNLRAAVRIHQQIIDTFPNFYEAYIDLAAIKGMNGDYRSAKELCEKAIKIKPDYANAHYYLGMASDALNDYSLARDEIRTALRLGLPTHFLEPARAVLAELENRR